MAHSIVRTIVPILPKGVAALRAAGFALLFLTLTLAMMIPGGPLVLRDYTYLEGVWATGFVPFLLVATLLAAASGTGLICRQGWAVMLSLCVAAAYLTLLGVHVHHGWAQAETALHQAISLVESFDALPAFAVVVFVIRGRMSNADAA